MMLTMNGITALKVKVDPVEFLYKLITESGMDLSMLPTLKYDEEKELYFYEDDISYHGSPIYERKYITYIDRDIIEFSKKIYEIAKFMESHRDLFKNLN